GVSFSSGVCFFISFFFQAEDGIRDFHVTGVQTCALPICMNWAVESPVMVQARVELSPASMMVGAAVNVALGAVGGATVTVIGPRSEERRVGKECRYRWVTYS